MKNYLFSGSINDIAKDLLKADLKEAKTLVGITAGNNIERNDMYFYDGDEKYPSTISLFKEVSNIKNFKLLDKRTTDKKAQEILKTADVIYLTGGNPFIQFDYINDNGLDTILKAFKGVVIGLSAGSMNQGKIVYYCKDEDYPETKTYEGFGLVDVTIDPHFDILNEEQVSEIKKWSEQIPIIGLPDDSFVVIDNSNTQFYGENYQYYDISKKKVI